MALCTCCSNAPAVTMLCWTDFLEYVLPTDCDKWHLGRTKPLVIKSCNFSCLQPAKILPFLTSSGATALKGMIHNLSLVECKTPNNVLFIILVGDANMHNFKLDFFCQKKCRYTYVLWGDLYRFYIFDGRSYNLHRCKNCGRRIIFQ